MHWYKRLSWKFQNGLTLWLLMALATGTAFSLSVFIWKQRFDDALLQYIQWRFLILFALFITFLIIVSAQFLKKKTMRNTRGAPSTGFNQTTRHLKNKTERKK